MLGFVPQPNLLKSDAYKNMTSKVQNPTNHSGGFSFRHYLSDADQNLFLKTISEISERLLKNLLKSSKLILINMFRQNDCMV